MILPLFLIIGIYGFPEFDIGAVAFKGGAIFTPTEAAVMCVALALVIGSAIYRQQRLSTIWRTVVDVMPRVGMLFWIVTNAVLFGFFLAQEGVPDAVAQWIVSLDMEPWMFLLLVNIVLIIIGFFMDGVPVILMFVPVLFPASQAMGIDPVHLGIIIIVNIELGLVTPPVGINLYVGSAVANLPVHTGLSRLPALDRRRHHCFGARHLRALAQHVPAGADVLTVGARVQAKGPPTAGAVGGPSHAARSGPVAPARWLSGIWRRLRPCA